LLLGQPLGLCNQSRDLSEGGLFGYGEFRHPFQDAPRLAAGRLHFFSALKMAMLKKTTERPTAIGKIFMAKCG
jgi:hypothetical protein